MAAITGPITKPLMPKMAMPPRVEINNIGDVMLKSNYLDETNSPGLAGHSGSTRCFQPEPSCLMNADSVPGGTVLRGRKK